MKVDVCICDICGNKYEDDIPEDFQSFEGSRKLGTIPGQLDIHDLCVAYDHRHFEEDDNEYFLDFTPIDICKDCCNAIKNTIRNRMCENSKITIDMEED